MAALNDKQFYIVLGLGAAGLLVGGFVAYKAYKAVSGAVSGAVDYVTQDAAGDALDVAKDVGTFVVGEPTVKFWGGVGDALGELWDWTGISNVPDTFDLNYRDQLPDMDDEEYQRWKTAVQNGDIANPFKSKGF